jgi:hypothetical protein
MSVMQSIVKEGLGLDKMIQNPDSYHKDIRDRILNVVHGAFRNIENSGEVCELIVVNKEDYKIMREYMPETLDQIGDWHFVKHGFVAYCYCAHVFVNDNAEDMLGFSRKMKCPNWLLKQFQSIHGKKSEWQSNNG